MLALHLFGWASIALGVGVGVYGGTAGIPAAFAASLGCILSGVLLLGFARALDLLVDIRDRLPTPAARQDAPTITAPAGSLQNLEVRLAALRERQPGS